MTKIQLETLQSIFIGQTIYTGYLIFHYLFILFVATNMKYIRFWGLYLCSCFLVIHFPPS